MRRSKIRVMCVDDHPVVLDGIALRLGQQPDMRVVAAVSTGEDALVSYERHRPDVTLMDLRLPRMSGLEAIRLIRRVHEDAKIVVLSMSDGEEDIHHALKAGAATYVLKECLADDLVRSIRAVYEGERPVLPDVAMRLASRELHLGLTSREVEILELMAEGRRNKEIAHHLAISPETVQVHVKHILAKLSVADRTAAVTEGVRRGIIHIIS